MPSETSERPSREECFMKMAFVFAKRSACQRLKVGCVITTADYQRVLGLGWNGGAKGFANKCDSPKAGECGCLHSEINALIKSGSAKKDKIVFCTDSPCLMCAKAMINSGISTFIYCREYRKDDGLNLLQARGIYIKRIPFEVIENV